MTVLTLIDLCEMTVLMGSSNPHLLNMELPKIFTEIFFEENSI